MSTLNPHEFWEHLAGELGVTLPEIPTEPEVEEIPEDPPCVHPPDDKVWNEEYFNAPGFPLRRCQVDGTKYWKAHKDGCLLEHATGSGKSLTGLMIASNMFDHSDFVIIACPLKDIAIQWEKEAREHFKSKVEIHVTDSSHKYSLVDIFLESKVKRKKTLILAVNDTITLKWKDFRDGEITNSFSLIIDEAHNWTSDDKIEFLKSNIEGKIKSMLTLTAKLYKTTDPGTPDQHRLLEGGVKKHPYELTKAIAEKNPRILKEYEYHLNLIPVDIDQEKSAMILQFEKLCDTKCMEIMDADNKTPTIVYVKRAENYGELSADRVSARLSEVGVNARAYIGKLTPTQRDKRKEAFNDGDLDALVAVKCLDEGVNIPKIQRLLLVYGSLDNEREWIQRRGRALRLDPKFPDDPIIHDFLPVPDTSSPTASHNRDTLEFIQSHSNKVIRLADQAKVAIKRDEYKEKVAYMESLLNG